MATTLSNRWGIQPAHIFCADEWSGVVLNAFVRRGKLSYG